MEIGSLCALGGGLPLGVKNALQYFDDELREYFNASDKKVETGNGLPTEQWRRCRTREGGLHQWQGLRDRGRRNDIKGETIPSCAGTWARIRSHPLRCTQSGSISDPAACAAWKWRFGRERPDPKVQASCHVHRSCRTATSPRTPTRWSACARTSSSWCLPTTQTDLPEDRRPRQQ